MEDKNKNLKKTMEVVKAYSERDEQINSDVFGSYTGNSEDNEKPIQDSDDI